MAYNYNNYYQPSQQGLIWVQGEAGAKAYIVAPATTLLLMDAEGERFYIKSSDSTGMPMPLRTFEYKEIGANRALASADVNSPTREEMNDLKGKIEALAKDIEELKGGMYEYSV